MDLKNNIHNILQWYEQIIEIGDKKKFMQYLYEFVTDYFRSINNSKYSNFKIEYQPHEICISIFYNKFIARIEGEEVKFYKINSDSAEHILIGSYSFFTLFVPHRLFEKKLKNYHPDYIIMMIEDSFSHLNIISEKINQKQYWLYR